MIPEACNLPVVSKPESRFSEGLVLRLRLVWNWDETIFPRDKCLLLISLHFERAVSVMRVRKREACSESCGNNLITHALTHHARSLVPRPPRPAFVACSTKSGGRPGRIYHVMRAATDVMFSLLMSGFVLSPSLFFP